MAAVLVWGKGGILDLIALKRQVRELEADISRLEQQNSTLREEIQTLKTDPSAYERLARERFFLKKPGEVVLYLPQVPSNAPAAPANTANSAAQPPPTPTP